MTDDQKMTALLDLLKEMSNEEKLILAEENLQEYQNFLKGLYDTRLKNIYTDSFRHLYSELSRFLGQQSADVYATLTEGLKWILDYGQEQHPEQSELNRGLQKLYDHIALESIRSNRENAIKAIEQESQTLQRETTVLLSEIRQETDTVQKNLEITQQAAQTAQENVKHFHEQSISILSIFSAVVLAFMGGLSFSSSILENFGEVSIFRLILTLLLLGFVLFDALFILLVFVVSVAQKNIRFRGWIIGFNIALGVLLAATIYAYANGYGAVLEAWGRS